MHIYEHVSGRLQNFPSRPSGFIDKAVRHFDTV